ncbi:MULTISPECIES: DUF4279 domain-containing protein [Streptomyces]|uniref:DUF4279 domain-containing protein n=2 Tax=Streptomyces TaxID=1883 RepID=A0ABU4JZ35_9ACTN|nr:DUF4279 domain-containing protein [Streptomyces roseolus]MDX2290752.1 DUF4279 domain-containing protein [Streptomyces roseolus]
MLLDQYVYFALSSERTTAQEMTALLGILPDETKVRGSRIVQPAIPVCHQWRVVCREPGLRVNEQIAQVLERLRPHTDRIASLTRRLGAEPGAGRAATLQVVRYFGEADEPSNDNQPDAERKPNPFGWHLDQEVLDFLAATGAFLDIDEYDRTD